MDFTVPETSRFTIHDKKLSKDQFNKRVNHNLAEISRKGKTDQSSHRPSPATDLREPRLRKPATTSEKSTPP